MNKTFYYLKYFILLFVVYLGSFLPLFALEEMELKVPAWLKDSNGILLKGNVKETIENVTAKTGIGVIGLRFIHQAGYPSFIEEVYPNSPASRAGILPKDLIFAIDGIKTDSLSSDHVYQLLTGEPGTNVKIFITRGKSMFNVDISREDLANLSPEVQNRYLSGPIILPVNLKDLLEYH